MAAAVRKFRRSPLQRCSQGGRSQNHVSEYDYEIWRVSDHPVRSNKGGFAASFMTDGQKLTLGDTTLTLYITPGHTPGTISVLIPVKDSGKPHLAALWGGTGLNADRESLQSYIRSAQRFSDIVRQAGADMILSNHTDWDRSKINLPLWRNVRRAAQIHTW